MMDYSGVDLVTRLTKFSLVHMPTSCYLIVPSEMTASSLSGRIAFSPQPLHSNGFFSCRGRTLVIPFIACSVAFREATSLRSFTAWHFSGLWYRPYQLQYHRDWLTSSISSCLHRSGPLVQARSLTYRYWLTSSIPTLRASEIDWRRQSLLFLTESGLWRRPDYDHR